MRPDPKKDPSRRCLRLEAWPEADRRAWAQAMAPGDLLEPGGPASRWSPYTQRKVVKGYGRWLTWLAQRDRLGADSGLARITRPWSPPT